MWLRLALAKSNLDQNDHNSNIEVQIMFTRMHEALTLKTGRPLKALVLAGALSLLAASAADAGGAPGGVVNNAKPDQGHHLSGTQHRGGHKGAAPNVGPIHIICSPYCEGGGSL